MQKNDFFSHRLVAINVEKSLINEIKLHYCVDRVV